MKKIITLLLAVFLIYSCSTTNDNVPIITATTILPISAATASSGGIITSDGGRNVTERGVVWSTNSNPTIVLPSKTVDGFGIGTFISDISGLTASTTYYIRAYATNAVGTAYANEISFTTNAITSPVTDNDGNTYSTENICGQVWTIENLNVSKYRNGDDIPQVTNEFEWGQLTTGAWCYYSNISTNGTTYGKLYNWYAVNDPRGLAPNGFHIPTNTEWNNLINCLGGGGVAGGKMKESGASHWSSSDVVATNSSGFTGLPGGWVYPGFELMGYFGRWWTASEYISPEGWNTLTNANYIQLYSYNNQAIRNYTVRKSGLSVRCIKD